MATQEEIFEKVQTALVDALAVEPEEVTDEATIQGDLGAESIDFLDIVFRLEKAFDIKIPQGELFPQNVFNDPQYVNDGKVTEAGLEELRKRMPFADLSGFAEDPKVENFGSLFTVGMVCKYVESKIKAKAEAEM